MDWPGSFVIDVDTDLDGLKRFVESFAPITPRGADCVWICARDDDEAIEWLLEAGQTVLVARSGASVAERMNAGMSLSKGDPIALLLASLIPPEGLFDSALAALRADGVGIVTVPDDRLPQDGKLTLGCPILVRRTLDLIGWLRDEPDPLACFADYSLRAMAAGVKVVALDEPLMPSDPTTTPDLPSAVLERATRYGSGERPLHVERAVRRDHRPMSPVQRLSLAFVTHERFDYLRKTWDGLWATTPELADVETEVVFADNGSSPEVREWLLGRDAWVVLNPTNWGISVARNQALAVSTGDPIVMIDPDILLPEGWYGGMLEVLAVPGVGFSAVSVEPTTYEVIEVDGTHVEAKLGNIAGVWLIPRRTLDVLGDFSEDYLYYGGEDSDYGERIMAAGMLNCYLPNTKGEHLGIDDGVYSEKRTDYVEMKAKWWDLNMALAGSRAKEYREGRRPLRYERATHRL